jgi:EpsI family protein
MEDFPKAIAEWKSEDVLLSKYVYELLGTKNLIMRNYKNKKGETVKLYVVYSQDNRKVSFPPEIELRDEDATITDKSPLKVTDSIKATKLIIEKGSYWELVVYWYKVGGLNTSIYFKQQLKATIDRMLGKKTSVALIRVSTEIENNKQDIALSRIMAFCALIEPLLEKYVP